MTLNKNSGSLEVVEDSANQKLINNLFLIRCVVAVSACFVFKLVIHYHTRSSAIAETARVTIRSEMAVDRLTLTTTL